jgi:hypothetical protein
MRNLVFHIASLGVAAMTAIWCAPAWALPSFITPDHRLPSPYRPYVKEDDAVVYGAGAATLYDLRFQAVNPADVSFMHGGVDSYLFDSTFPIAYEMLLSIGTAPPVHVSGHGVMHAIGDTGLGARPIAVLVDQLDLHWPGSMSEMFFRELPGTGDYPYLNNRSGGVINLQPIFPGLVIERRISSSLFILSEITLDGGATWLGADSAIDLVQAPEPSSIALAAVSLCGAVRLARRNRSSRRCSQHVLDA